MRRPLFVPCNLAVVLALLMTLMSANTAVAATSADPAATGGAFRSLKPVVVFGSRIAAGQTVTVAVPGAPSGSTAWLTTGVTTPAAGGSLVLFTAGTAAPAVPSVLFASGQSATAAAAVPVSAGGQIQIRNASSQAVATRVELTGVFEAGVPASAGMAGWVTPFVAANSVTIPAQGSASYQVAGIKGVPNTAAAVFLTMAANATTSGGTVTAYPAGASVPATASLHLSAGRPQAGLGVVRVGSSGRVTVLNRTGSAVSISMSVGGYLLPGNPVVVGAFQKIAPASLFSVAISAGAGVDRTVTGQATIPTTGVSAVALQLVASSTGADGAVVATAPGGAGPTLATVQWSKGRSASGLVIAPIDASGRVRLTNLSSGSVTVQAEVVGYVLSASRLTWTAPQQINTLGPAQYSAVSCASSSFCMAADNSGFFSRFDGTAWSRTASSQVIDTGEGSNGVRDLSCASPTFCAVVYSWTDFWSPVLGRTFLWNGSSWREVSWNVDPSGLGATSIECPSVSFCLATLDDGGYSVFNGTTWSVHSEQRSISSMSCASATFCLGTDATGLIRFDGSSWAPAPSAPLPGAPTCASSTFCLLAAKNAAGQPMSTRFDGTQWSTPSAAPDIARVTCFASTSCVGVTGTSTWSWNGSSWAQSSVLPFGVSDIDCGSSTSCAAVSGNRLSTSTSGSWKTPTVAPDDPAPLFHLDCVDSSFCAATDRWDIVRFSAATVIGKDLSVAIHQNTTEDSLRQMSCVSQTFCATTGGAIFPSIRMWDGQQWQWGHDQRYAGLSCVSTSFCLAVTPGESVRFDGAAWNQVAGALPLTAVSCVSRSFCLATGAASGASTGLSAVFDGTTWGSAIPLANGAGGAPVSLSCQSATLCLAADTAGRVSVFTGKTWSPAASVTGVAKVVAVSCRTEGACLAAGEDRTVSQRTAGGWTPAQRLSGAGKLTDLSCPTSQFCAAIDDAGQVVYGRT